MISALEQRSLHDHSSVGEYGAQKMSQTAWLKRLICMLRVQVLQGQAIMPAKFSRAFVERNVIP